MSVLAWQALSVLVLVTTAGLAWLAYGNRADNPEQAVSAWLGREGLRVECRIDDPAMPVCEQVVRLGDCLADRLAGSRARGGMRTRADKALNPQLASS